VTSAQCSACGAAVAVGAPWCTLCFADLRPPVEAPLEAPAPPVAVAAGARPVSPPAALPPHPILDAPVAKPADVKLAAPAWPCQECGKSVALDLTECDGCGAAFLGGTQVDVSLKLPGIGDVVTMAPGRRAGLMAGGALGFALVLVLVYVVLGHFV
jgi:hypothetical protein